MIETEIRARLREAFGEYEYPQALTSRVRVGLNPHPTPGHPRLIGFVAAILAVAVVAGLLYVRTFGLRSEPSATPPVASPPNNSPAPPMSPLQQVPTADLAPSGLTTAVGLMVDPNIVSTNNGRTVRLIGAYADHARIVLIFRTLPAVVPGPIEISDDHGQINAGGGGGQGSLGDSVIVIDQGPHADSQGIAHLQVTIPFLQVSPPGEANLIQGPWNFALALKVQPSIAVALENKPATLGSWKVSVEAFELTPSVIHLTMLVSGASPDAVSSAVTLLDEKGSLVQPLDSSNNQVGSTMRLNYSWPRASSDAKYQLQITGGGARYSASFTAPALVTPTPDANSAPKLPSPYDLPTADESISLQGVLNENVNFGHPWQCRAVTDPSGAAFLLDIYFRSRSGAWYLLGLVTDLADKPYSGPGTYGVRAYISALATNGPSDHMFQGSGTLTITSTGSKFSGTANVKLAWDDDPKQQVGVSGGWTCQATG